MPTEELITPSVGIQVQTTLAASPQSTAAKLLTTTQSLRPPITSTAVAPSPASPLTNNNHALGQQAIYIAQEEAVTNPAPVTEAAIEAGAVVPQPPIDVNTV